MGSDSFGQNDHLLTSDEGLGLNCWQPLFFLLKDRSWETASNNLPTTSILSRKKVRKTEGCEQSKQSPRSLDFRGTFYTCVAITVYKNLKNWRQIQLNYQELSESGCVNTIHQVTFSTRLQVWILFSDKKATKVRPAHLFFSSKK